MGNECDRFAIGMDVPAEDIDPKGQVGNVLHLRRIQDAARRLPVLERGAIRIAVTTDPL